MSKRSPFREYLEALIIAGIFLGFTNTFVVKTFFIPSASMEETLLIGDHLFVNRFIYGAKATEIENSFFPLRQVERGDIVIFRSPERPLVDMVKRCVALPGDEIKVMNKELFINGDRVDDDFYTWHRDARIFQDLPAVSESARRRDNFGSYVVPAEHYFCLGDNRDQSYDSRFWGPVPSHFVKGRAFLIYWSFGGETSDGVWRGWRNKMKQLAGTAAGFFHRTRWERTFRIIR